MSTRITNEAERRLWELGKLRQGPEDVALRTWNNLQDELAALRQCALEDGQWVDGVFQHQHPECPGHTEGTDS